MLVGTHSAACIVLDFDGLELPNPSRYLGKVKFSVGNAYIRNNFCFDVISVRRFLDVPLEVARKRFLAWSPNAYRYVHGS